MLTNRSAPPGTVVPHIGYDDVAQAIEWLCRAFGFTERLRFTGADGTVQHAQLTAGVGGVILGASGATPLPLPFMVRIEDADAHAARAERHGAHVITPPATHPYGERQHSAVDLAGYRWTFTQTVADVAPEAWGATATDIWRHYANLPRPRFCYVQIPAADPERSADFYEALFGWRIRGRGTGHPSFDDHTLSGAWVAGWPPSREPGLLPSIWVDSIDETLARAVALGGEVIAPPHRDAPDPGAQWIATFRDPAGNVMGLYQEGSRG